MIDMARSTSTVERLLALEVMSESPGPLQAFRERSRTKRDLIRAYRHLRTHLRRSGIQMPLHDLDLLCRQRIERLDRQQMPARRPLQLRLRQTLTKKAEELFWGCGYRRAQSSWVGGELNGVTVVVNGTHPSACTEVEKRWSRNGKWSGNAAHHTIVLPRGWGAVARLGLIEALGVFLLHAEPEEHPDFEAWEVVYVKQGRGLSVDDAWGYVVRQGEHVVLANTLAGAVRKLRRELGPCAS